MVSRVLLSEIAGITSEKRNDALNYAFCLFIEVDSFSSDVCVYYGFIEESFHHVKKLAALVGL